MGSEMKIHFSDEEEDLESLRLAALSSLKKKNEINEFPMNQQFSMEKNYKNTFRGGKRRYFPGLNGRNGRNGQFNNQIRNSNLISIPTTTEEPQKSPTISTKFTKTEEEAPKLVRPQDRYANSNNDHENEGPSSKFDRYDNSNSDSEEDDEISSTKIKRSNSLEALMEELDAEIQGERKVEKKPEVTGEIVENVTEETVVNDNKDEVIEINEVTVETKQPEIFTKTKHKSPKRHLNRRPNGRIFNPEPNFIPNPIIIPNFINPPQFTTVYNSVPSFSAPEIYPVNVPPPNFLPPPGLPPHIPTYPLQPLIIEPQVVPMGPLSPRSAAFVLENRAIVEKRKRSPSRRSYSRSPSPHRSRFSKTPPLRRSLSPIRRSPVRRSLSPAGTARRSPVRRSLSPYRKYRDRTPPKRIRDSPKRSKESPKKSHKIGVKERLGAKNKDEKNVKKKEEVPQTKDEVKNLDPVLEARKKKFESNEIKVKEGVIRLRPKDEHQHKNNTNIKLKTNDEKSKPKKIKQEIIEKTEEQSTRIVLLPKNVSKTPPLTPPRDQLEEAMNELEMLLKDDEALELSAKVDELFTDEETDQENEGRFKVKKQKEETTKPSRKLSNGTKIEKRKTPKEPLTNPIENRKIEIKIRNPSKYEKVQSSSRKMSEDDDDGDESEPEIIVENDDDEEESREGDLRAQLSRKRAGRQNKLPTVEGVQSRLLQSALEGAVFKKKRSKKKDKEIKDVKVPIHLRLGVAHDSEVFTEKLTRKKAKKRKHNILDQV